MTAHWDIVDGTLEVALRRHPVSALVIGIQVAWTSRKHDQRRGNSGENYHRQLLQKLKKQKNKMACTRQQSKTQASR